MKQSSAKKFDSVSQNSRVQYSSQQVKMPLTDYYAKKFEAGGAGGALPRSQRFGEPFVQQTLDNENSVMLMAQQ